MFFSTRHDEMMPLIVSLSRCISKRLRECGELERSKLPLPKIVIYFSGYRREECIEC